MLKPTIDQLENKPLHVGTCQSILEGLPAGKGRVSLPRRSGVSLCGLSILLTNPSKIWEKANLENKMRIQVFNFPYCITFDGENYRTPEICRLYKAKIDILDADSLSVRPKESFIKFHPKVANLPSLNGDKSAPSNADNPNTKDYWIEVLEELKIAGEIVKSVESIDSS